jgi:hypothetical protein
VHHHPAFHAAPTLVQFTSTGHWEDAWSFAPSACPDTSALRDYLVGCSEVAFEVFFGEAFFGARVLAPVHDVEQRVLAFVNCVRSARDGKALFPRLQDQGFLHAAGAGAAFTEIGAVNAWRSVGAVKLPAPQQALRQIDAWWPALQASAVGQNTTHPKAIEFAYEAQIAHWYALPASPKHAPYALSKALVQAALEAGASPQ